MSSAISETGKYLSVTTFRRDGRGVATPVWFVALDRRYYIFSEGKAGKVKRIRATGKVRLAPCTFRGGITGEAVEGVGRLVEDGEKVRSIYREFGRKYGLQFRILNLFSYLSRRISQRSILELEVLPALEGL